MVIEPLLIDEDYYARVEGREIISNLAKVRKGFFIIDFQQMVPHQNKIRKPELITI